MNNDIKVYLQALLYRNCLLWGAASTFFTGGFSAVATEIKITYDPLSGIEGQRSEKVHNDENSSTGCHNTVASFPKSVALGRYL